MSQAHTAQQAPNETEACQALAVAVIHQALLDATKTTPAGFTRSQLDMDDARAFLLRGGEWAQARQFWCHHAGLTPEWLDRRVRALQAEGRL